jgi:hypothetical protein
VSEQRRIDDVPAGETLHLVRDGRAPVPAEPQDECAAEPGIRPSPDRVALPRWVGPLFLLLAAGLVPWIVFLAVTLPRRAEAAHYRLAWVGFDVGMLGVLAAFGWLAMRRSRWTQPLASCAATLLAVDAWFDVVTAASRHDLLMAVGSAVIFELPLAVLCVWLARNAEEIMRQRMSRLWDRVLELEGRLRLGRRQQDQPR